MTSHQQCLPFSCFSAVPLVWVVLIDVQVVWGWSRPSPPSPALCLPEVAQVALTTQACNHAVHAAVALHGRQVVSMAFHLLPRQPELQRGPVTNLILYCLVLCALPLGPIWHGVVD